MIKQGPTQTQYMLTGFLCVLIFLNSENVYFKRSDLVSALFEIILIITCLIYIYVNKLYKKLNSSYAITLLLISLIYISVVLIIYATNLRDSSINNTLQKLSVLGILLPLLILIFNGLGYPVTLSTIIRTYINIAATVSFLGLILWFLSNIGIPLPVIHTPYQWGGPKIGTGVFGLTFDVQYSDIAFARGWSRYTLFYIEGGIAAAYFGLGGILEATCMPEPRMPIVFMFAICTFCTLSGFGMILSPIVICIGLLCSGHLKNIARANAVTFAVTRLLIPTLILITPIIINSLFSQKTNEGSIAAHSNDFTYGFKVFQDRPILGYGIGNYSPLVNTVDGISGTSSSLMIGLIQGGFIYVAAILAPLLCASVLAIANKQYRSAALFASLILLYINGMSDNSPMYICMMALAFAYIHRLSINHSIKNKDIITKNYITNRQA
ncbi:polymerase [Bifidobacterium gallicum DSM 20093 = LMG 11596]|nr:polymerase [Bifidobacterium gallicum DSM 20093 = LMG 11596]